MVRALLEANADYSIGFQINGTVREALLLIQEEAWRPAIEIDGTRRLGAEIVELTRFVDLSGWGRGCRLICHRERPHPGAQLSLFDSVDGWRHTAFITNTPGDIATLELRHRGHARVEDRVRCWKATGMTNVPFDDYTHNQARQTLGEHQGEVGFDLCAVFLGEVGAVEVIAERRSCATPWPLRVRTSRSRETVMPNSSLSVRSLSRTLCLVSQWHRFLNVPSTRWVLRGSIVDAITSRARNHTSVSPSFCRSDRRSRCIAPIPVPTTRCPHPQLGLFGPEANVEQ